MTDASRAPQAPSIPAREQAPTAEPDPVERFRSDVNRILSGALRGYDVDRRYKTEEGFTRWGVG